MKSMEEIIAKDLGISVDEIRRADWSELEKRPRKFNERSFRPKDSFPINGNINLALGREMGITCRSIREFKRGVCYKLKCLLKNKMHA